MSMEKINNYITSNEIILKEEIDMKKLSYIISNIDGYIDIIGSFTDTNNNYSKIREKSRIVEILKNRLKVKDNKIKYKYSTRLTYGRLFSVGTSLQSINKIMRHTLSKDFYYDIDIRNCHPILVEFLGRTMGLKTSCLKHYIDNRDEVINYYKDIHIDDPKTFFLCMLYDGKNVYKQDDFITELHIEISKIRETVSKSEKHMFNRAKRLNYDNSLGSCLSYKICDMENKIIQCSYNYLLDNKIEVGALCFDGLMIKKDTVDNLEELLINLNKHIYETLDINLEFIEKPMTMGIDIDDKMLTINDDKIDIPDDDESIGIYVLNKIYENKDLYYNENTKNIYIYNEKNCLYEEYRDLDRMMTFISPIMIPLINEKMKNISNDETLKYLKCFKKNLSSTQTQRNIFKQMKIRLRSDSEFINNTFDSIPHLFPIADNQVVNLKTLEVLPRLKEHYFTKTTDCIFKYDRPRKDEIRKYIREILNTTNEKYVDCYLAWDGYQLTFENVIKMFMLHTGDGNNGKSLKQKLLESILGCFHLTPSKKVLLECKNESSHNDELCRIVGKRSTSQKEIDKNSIWNERLIKTVTGGDGDVSMRPCGGRTFEYNVRSKLNAICNDFDIPKFKDQQGFQNRIGIFCYSNTFTKDPIYEKYILSLKNDYFTEICFAVKEFFYDNDMKINFTEEVIEASNQYKNDNDTIRQYINQCLDITNNKSHRIPKPTLYMKYTNFCSTMGSNDVMVGRNEFYKTLLTKYNITTYRERDFCGIVFKTDE